MQIVEWHTRFDAPSTRAILNDEGQLAVVKGKFHELALSVLGIVIGVPVLLAMTVFFGVGLTTLLYEQQNRWISALPSAIILLAGYLMLIRFFTER